MDGELNHPAPRAPLAKGTNLVGILAAIESELGAEMRAAVLARVPAELCAAVETGRVVVSGWYPLAWYKALHAAAQQVSGREPRLAWELAHVFVLEQLGGIYKALLKLISPHWLFHYPTMIFSRYFSQGTLTVPECRAGYVRGVWTDCSEFDRNIWFATFGGSQAALERAGAKEVHIEIVRGAGDGDDYAEAIGTWK
jgi:hypothetical protein